MLREIPQVRMKVHRESAEFFTKKAKEHVHKITHTLEKSISVESATPQMGIISAKTSYARTEEERKGNRRIPPHTPHPYMKPAAQETAVQMPIIIKRHIDDLLRRHKTN